MRVGISGPPEAGDRFTMLKHGLKPRAYFRPDQ